MSKYNTVMLRYGFKIMYQDEETDNGRYCRAKDYTFYDQLDIKLELERCRDERKGGDDAKKVI